MQSFMRRSHDKEYRQYTSEGMSELLDDAQWRGVIRTASGLGAGAISTVLLYPLDLVKVRYQVHAGSSRPYQSLPHAFRSVVAEHGFRSLFRGMSPALYGATISWGLYMFFYAQAKERYESMTEDGQLRPGSWQFFMSGIEAGCICVPLTNPIWLIKTRMQVQTRRNAQHASVDTSKDAASKIARQNLPYSSVSNAFRRIVAEEGFLSLYRGMIPAFILTTNGAFKFFAYEALKGTYQTHVSPDMSIVPTLAMGALSQSFASTITYPYQVIKARLQQGGPSALAYNGTWDCTKKIFLHEGYTGFFKGLSANILKVMPTGAIVFASYEKINSTLTSLVFK